MNNKILIFLAVAFIPMQALAGTITIPNTFVDGTTASASEVNANFNAVKTEVNDNNSRITTNTTDIQTNAADIQSNTIAIGNVGSVHVLVNGVRRGALLDAYRSPAEQNVFSSIIYRVLLDSGYFAIIMVAGDGLREVRLDYESADCTGQAYIGKGGWNDLPARQGIVRSNDSPAPGTLYMIQAGTAMEVIQIESNSLDGVCTTQSEPNTEAYKANANDPAITGVIQADFVGVVTLGF